MPRRSLLSLLLLGSALLGCRADGAAPLDTSEVSANLGPGRVEAPATDRAPTKSLAQVEPVRPAPASATAQSPQALEASVTESEGSRAEPDAAPSNGPLIVKLATERDALGDATARYKRLSPTAQQGAFGQALLAEIRTLQDEVERLASAIGG